MRQLARAILPTAACRWLAMRLNTHFCPVCENGLDSFRPFGTPTRNNAQCFCGSLERHRLIWLYLQQHTNLADGVNKRMLHIAPEPCLGAKIASVPGVEYVSGDLDPSAAMIQVDVTQINFPDEHFDAIYCSHVLEHVAEDRLAMREFFRVLKPGGWAILQVPIRGEETYEDFAITAPAERRVHFGQEDHLRWYGAADYVRRLSSAGFAVGRKLCSDNYLPWEIKKMGLNPAENIFSCRKPACVSDVSAA